MQAFLFSFSSAWKDEAKEDDNDKNEAKRIMERSNKVPPVTILSFILATFSISVKIECFFYQMMSLHLELSKQKVFNVHFQFIFPDFHSLIKCCGKILNKCNKIKTITGYSSLQLFLSALLHDRFSFIFLYSKL